MQWLSVYLLEITCENREHYVHGNCDKVVYGALWYGVGGLRTSIFGRFVRHESERCRDLIFTKGIMNCNQVDLRKRITAGNDDNSQRNATLGN